MIENKEIFLIAFGVNGFILGIGKPNLEEFKNLVLLELENEKETQEKLKDEINQDLSKLLNSDNQIKTVDSFNNIVTINIKDIIEERLFNCSLIGVKREIEDFNYERIIPAQNNLLSHTHYESIQINFFIRFEKYLNSYSKFLLNARLRNRRRIKVPYNSKR